MSRASLDKVMRHIRTLAAGDYGKDKTDGDLLRAFAFNNDQNAFTALAKRHGPLVWAVCRRVLSRPEDAEDAFQATFIVLGRRAASLWKKCSLGGWLHCVSYRICLDARKAAARRQKHERQVKTVPSISPEHEAAWREVQTLLDQEIQRLPERLREPFLLCCLENKSCAETARRLGIKEGTIGSRLTEARKNLHKRLLRRGVELGGALAAAAVASNPAAAKVPAALLVKVVEASFSIATGTGVGTGMVSERVVSLVKGIMASGLLTKTKIGVALFVTLGLSVAGIGGFQAASVRGVQGENKKTSQAFLVNGPPLDGEKKKPPATDVNGDPLPAGAVTRVGSNRFRHDEMVQRLIYTPDGKSIGSTSVYGAFYVWDAASGKLRARFPLDTSSDRALAASRDSKRLAIVSNAHYVEVAADSGKVLARHRVLKPGDDIARCVAISPDLAVFARGCFDGTIRLYDALSGQEKRRIVAGGNQPIAMDFSPDSSRLFVAVNEKPGIAIFDAKSGELIKTLETTWALNYPCHVVHSNKDNLLAVIDKETLILWDLAKGTQRFQIENEAHELRSGCRPAFSHDDKVLFAPGGHDVVLFSTAPGKTTSVGVIPSVSSRFVELAPDGKTLAAGDPSGTIQFWNINTKAMIAPSPEPTSYWRIRFANNGKEILFDLGKGAEWWDVASGKMIRRVAPDEQRRDFMTLSPDGSRLAGSMGSHLILTDAATGKRVHTFSALKWPSVTTAFSSDGSKLFSSASWDSRIMVWDTMTGKLLHELKESFTHANHLQVSPDGRWLASASTSGPAPGQMDIRVWDVKAGKLAKRLPLARAYTYAMTFTPDSSRLVSAGGSHAVGEIDIWDITSGKMLRRFTGRAGFISSLAITPSIAITPGPISSLAITPDGRMLATGGWDKTLRLWEADTGQERARINGHEGHVFSLDFSPDGRLLAAASSDAPVYIWDAYTALKAKLSAGALSKDNRDKLWEALAETNTAAPFQAICELVARPVEAVAVLEEGWKRLPKATPEQMQKWVADLSSDQFPIRKSASTELERFAFQHEDLLRGHLKQSATLEVRQRLERILEQVEPQRLRRSRMLEVLEQVKTPAARQFLRRLAGQTDDVVLAREAAASLARLAEGNEPNRIDPD